MSKSASEYVVYFKAKQVKLRAALDALREAQGDCDHPFDLSGTFDFLHAEIGRTILAEERVRDEVSRTAGGA